MTIHVVESSSIAAKSEQASINPETGDLYVVQNRVAYGLNPVGRRIWELIQQPVKVSQVRDNLLEEYDVDPDLCMQDLIALLNDLVEKGLAELQNAEAE